VLLHRNVSIVSIQLWDGSEPVLNLVLPVSSLHSSEVRQNHFLQYHAIDFVYHTECCAIHFQKIHDFLFGIFTGQVYRETVEPIIPIIFQRTKATCFAYGQTGWATPFFHRKSNMHIAYL
jgi:hypothetical protein